MSVVCAKISKDSITIAADSGAWSGDDTVAGICRPKLVKIDDNFAIGGCGNLGEVYAFQRYATSHRPTESTEETIFKLMLDFYEWWNRAEEIVRPGSASADAKERPASNEYLIALDGNLFTCEGTYVAQVACFDAIGAAAHSARTSLVHGLDPVTAVSTASLVHPFVELPVASFTIPRQVADK